MKKICLDCYTPEEFFKELIPLLQPLLSRQPTETSQSNVLTRKQAAAKLNITLSTLNTWTKLGLINAYRKGRRVYYKPEELISSLRKINHQKYKQKES